MTHAEFVRGYREGRLQVRVERQAAIRVMAARSLLPLVLLPLLGLGVALALMGMLVAGIALFVAALGLRALVRASSQGFIVARALQDPAFYDEMLAKEVLEITILAA